MTTTNKYLDLQGLQFFYTNLKKVFRTEAQVSEAIDTALSTALANYTTTANSVQKVAPTDFNIGTASESAGTEGVLYIVDTVTGVAPNEEHSYQSYVYEGGAWIPLESGAALQALINALTTRVGNLEGVVNVDSNTGAVTLGSVASGDTKAVSGGSVYTALQDYVPLTQKGAANGVAPLGADGKIANTYLPDLAVTDVDTVTNMAAYATYLTTNPTTDKVGDVIIVTNGDGDNHPAYYMITGVDNVANPTTYTTTVITPTTSVASVAGKTGTVTLDTGDITDWATKVGDVLNIDGTSGALSCDAAPTQNSDKAVSSGGVYTAVDAKLDKTATLSETAIDSLFIGADEVWFDTTGWAAMYVRTDNSGTFTQLTANNYGDGYYVWDVSELTAGDVNTLEISADGSTAAATITGVSQLTDITSDLVGKIWVATAGEATLTEAS